MKVKKQNVYKYRKDNKEYGVLRTLKENTNYDEYMKRLEEKDMNVIKCRIPSINTMTKWLNDGVARSVDGCRVEPDGVCLHGYPSFIRVLGFI